MVQEGVMRRSEAAFSEKTCRGMSAMMLGASVGEIRLAGRRSRERYSNASGTCDVVSKEGVSKPAVCVGQLEDKNGSISLGDIVRRSGMCSVGRTNQKSEVVKCKNVF